MSERNFEMLIEFTKDDDARTRAMAIAGLAKIRDVRGFAPVVITLFDPVDEVRITAATALGLFADVRAFEPLMQGLDDPCERVGVNCAWALGQLPDTRAFDALLDIICDHERAIALRTAAATSLGERAEHPGSDLACSDEFIERARVALLDTLDDNDGEIRASAVWTLGHFPADKQTTLTCIELLNDDYEWVVRYAIEALAHFGDKTAITALSKIADCAEADIAELALHALSILR